MFFCVCVCVCVWLEPIKIEKKSGEQALAVLLPTAQSKKSFKMTTFLH